MSSNHPSRDDEVLSTTTNSIVVLGKNDLGYSFDFQVSAVNRAELEGD